MKNSNHNKGFLLIVLVLGIQAINGQTVFGKWKTIDDKTGVTKAIVDVYEKNGLLNAKIVQVLEEGREDALCIKCEGELKDKPEEGMQIRRNSKKKGEGEDKGKSFLDPKKGPTNKGKVGVDGQDSNKWKVRGYVAFLYRTQTWHRVTDAQ